GVDPRAGSQLEVLRDPSVERYASCRIVRIDQVARITEEIETLLVEGGFASFRLAPISGHEIRAANREFHPSIARHHLERGARHRYTDIESVVAREIDNRHRHCFGGPQAR